MRGNNSRSVLLKTTETTIAYISILGHGFGPRSVTNNFKKHTLGEFFFLFKTPS